MAASDMTSKWEMTHREEVRTAALLLGLLVQSLTQFPKKRDVIFRLTVVLGVLPIDC